jgi:uncharacterized damage-inducible protein DinB
MPAAGSETARILDQLEREHSGDAWHGTPLRQLLADVGFEQAAARPAPGMHTIWEIVLHMTAWKNEVRRRLGGAPSGTPTEGDWPVPAPPGARAWRAAVDALEEAQRALAAVVANIPDTQLHVPTNDTRDRATGGGVSYYVLLHGIIQHDVYHSGQIALLKKTGQRTSG